MSRFWRCLMRHRALVPKGTPRFTSSKPGDRLSSPKIMLSVGSLGWARGHTTHKMAIESVVVSEIFVPLYVATTHDMQA